MGGENHESRISFYEGMTALDAIGPHEILCRLPNASVFRVAKQAGPIQTDSQLILTADYSLADVTSADILLVPGAGNATTLSNHSETLEWLRSIHATTTWTTSVCTGSLILGACRHYSNLKAATHWAAFDRLKKGKAITAAGVSAGIDMALILSSKIAGEKFAQAMQLGIEYDSNPPFDVGSSEKADPVIREGLRNRMIANFLKDF
jgi:putative intracellular protease/amidase